MSIRLERRPSKHAHNIALWDGLQKSFTANYVCLRNASQYTFVTHLLGTKLCSDAPLYTTISESIQTLLDINVACKEASFQFCTYRKASVLAYEAYIDDCLWALKGHSWCCVYGLWCRHA